ncbi:hypothetical protein P8452_56940 [Trifolium repens]|nr:hypothetical protein P8452_56940 [Trifolium repens]
MAREDELSKEQAREQELNKGKNTLVATTHPASPLKIDTTREVGSTSSEIHPAILERFELQDAKIASLAEDSQAQKVMLNKILSVLMDLQKNRNQNQQPSPNPNPYDFLCLSTLLLLFILFGLLKSCTLHFILIYFLLS